MQYRTVPTKVALLTLVATCFCVIDDENIFDNAGIMITEQIDGEAVMEVSDPSL